MVWQKPPSAPRRPIGLWVALLLYAGLGVFTVREIGTVGEVAQSWTTGRPAPVLVSAEPVLWSDGGAGQTAGHRWGPLIASQSRPIETLQIGGLALPLAVNQYTGGVPDWPARILVALTGAAELAQGLHLLLGGLLIVLVHRFVRFHGTDIAATIAALILATDWGFVFYREALGGTELVLQAAVLLCLWALWSRRWGGGRHGLTALGIGLGLGIGAKLTFGLSFLALILSALLLRGDKPALRPPLPTRPWVPLLWTGLLCAPLAIAYLHHALAVPDAPHIISHDFASMQWDRVTASLTGGPSQARESSAALLAWLGDPSSFLETAWGAQVQSSPPWLRWLGWGLVVLGALSAWRDRHPTPQLALLRFTGLFLVLQVLIVWVVAKDMHHLGMAKPIAAILAGLALDALSARWTPPKSPQRAALCLVLALPWMIAGSLALSRTDGALSTIEQPTVTRSGQDAIAQMLTHNGVERLVLIDYDLAGALDPLVPQISLIHGWGLASQAHRSALRPLLRLGAGGHLLIIPGSAPWSYNLKPRAAALLEAGSSVGLEVVAVDRLPDGGAVLYALSRAEGSP